MTDDLHADARGIGKPRRFDPMKANRTALPPRDHCALPHVLEHRAALVPGRRFAVFDDGTDWTFADAWSDAKATAAFLRRQGLGKGDVLLLWLPNGRAFLRAWFGANLLGAIISAPNLAYHGAVLTHIVGLSGARLALIDPALAGRCGEVPAGGRPRHLLIDETPLAAPELLGSPGEAELPVIEPWDTQLVMFTSGTTGPSKGVIVPYAQLHATARAHFSTHMTPDDRYLVNLPLFHIGGLMPVMGALITGGSIAVVERFVTERFWEDVRHYDATAATMMGAAAAFLAKQPPSQSDRDHPLRWVSMLPMLPESAEFAERFGVRLFTGYGMSELSIPITSGLDPEDPTSCGTLRPGFEARIVDEQDRMVPVGKTGELVLRADVPWTISPGYWRDPAATAAAWRNGWFHTGDGMRCDSEGRYYFIDRRKDAIRRRGENISSYEVEAGALTHPAVAEAAAVAVPSPFGEDDVMLVVVCAEGASVEPRALFDHLRLALPHFMVPRYIRL